MKWHDSVAPLRERNFRWYFASRFANTLGNMMAGVALAFAVLAITDSATALGLVLASATIPTVVFLLWGGVIADRFSRAMVLQVSSLVAGLTQAGVAVLVISDTAEIWMLMALEAVHGLAAAAAYPAMLSSVTWLWVVVAAFGLLNAIQVGAIFTLGPTLAKDTIGEQGWGLVLSAEAAGLLLMTLLLLRLRLQRPLFYGMLGISLLGVP